MNPGTVAAALEALARALGEPGTPAPAPAPPVQVTLPWNVLLWRRDLVPDDTLLTVMKRVVREAREPSEAPAG